ncbi:MAG: TlpA family protein disulfide reductase, partial [Actinobacteria bacterium]|nr:TlpA family protein disulfide reductase [Actinomycetota bacterium]
MLSLPRSSRRCRGRRAVAAAALTLAAACGLGACSAAGSAQSTAMGNGQNFVSGDSGTTVFRASTGPMAPPVSGTTLTGAKLSLSAFRGHVVVLNFWGSWCTPCRVEAPALAALARKYQPAGVRFVGVDIRDN